MNYLQSLYFMISLEIVKEKKNKKKNNSNWIWLFVKVFYDVSCTTCVLICYNYKMPRSYKLLIYLSDPLTTKIIFYWFLSWLVKTKFIIVLWVMVRVSFKWVIQRFYINKWIFVLCLSAIYLRLILAIE